MALKFICVQGFFFATAVHSDKYFMNINCQLNDQLDKVFRQNYS